MPSILADAENKSNSPSPAPSRGLFCCPLPEVLFRGKARIHAGDCPLKGQSVRHVRHGFEGCVGEDEGPVVPAPGGRGVFMGKQYQFAASKQQATRARQGDSVVLPKSLQGTPAALCRYTFRRATGKTSRGKIPESGGWQGVGGIGVAKVTGKSHGARPVGSGGGTTLFCQK